MRRRVGAEVAEVFDSGLSPQGRAAELDDVDRLSRWFRGYALTLRHLRRVTAGPRASGRLLIVDVGGGRGDFAKRLVEWGRRRRWMLRVIVIDTAPDLLQMARVLTGQYPEIVLLGADARRLPLRSSSVDITTASLLLHHLEPEGVVETLAEMSRTARRAIVVNDLLRTRVSVALVWLATRLFARTWMARHDGPRAVARAYSPSELRRLARRAGVERLGIRRHPMWARLVAVAR